MITRANQSKDQTFKAPRMNILSKTMPKNGTNIRNKNQVTHFNKNSSFLSAKNSKLQGSLRNRKTSSKSKESNFRAPMFDYSAKSLTKRSKKESSLSRKVDRFFEANEKSTLSQTLLSSVSVPPSPFTSFLTQSKQLVANDPEI